jgi:predicted PurR-regulated permease PerM
LGVLVYSGIDIFSPSKAIDVPYPVLLGVLSGIANLIPVVGMKLIWIPLASYMWGNAYLTGILIENTSFLIFATLAIYFIVDSFPDTILRPYLAGREHIPMGLLFFTYIFGTAVFGLAGIILGPIILVVTVNFFRLVLPEIKKDQ